MAAGVTPPMDDPRRARARFHAHAGTEAWADAVAAAMADALRADLDANGRARLLLSGGTTPAPAYHALSHAALDWSRVDIALVDERWLPPDDPDSNARMVRDSLLQHRAAEARFEPMTQPGRTLEESVAAANAHARRAASAVALGMGEDGHTASLFPRCRDLDRALASQVDYVSFDAAAATGARQWPLRITLTPAGLAKARTRLLLIRGEAKRRLFDRVLDGDDPREFPVRIAFGTPGPTLQVHWCP